MAPQKPNALAAPRQKTFSSLLIWIVVTAFKWSYGSLMLFAFVLRSRLGNPRFRRMDDDDKEQLAAARDRLWNLQKQPLGLKHAFCQLRNQVRLHYVYSRPTKELKGKTGLVIFIHGFPDSWFLWHNLLKSSHLKDTANLVAVDLPGYGGSDDLDRYDADNVMEAMSEFITKMRGTYASYSDDGQQAPVIVVAHDWGALIGFRLASEAPVLADRFILSNSLHPPLFRANIENRINFMSQMVKTWIHSPFNWRPLARLMPSAKPLLVQTLMSGYIFSFNTPWPLPLILGQIGNFWMFRLLNAFAESNKPKEPLPGIPAWDALAATIGPGYEELGTKLSAHGKALDPLNPDEELQYPASVKSRVSTGGWSEKIRLYREDLLASPWNKSLQCVWELSQIEEARNSLSSTGSSSQRRRSSVSSKSAGVFNMGPPGSLTAPTTVLWGLKDVALNLNLALDGISDYFGARDSHVITLQKVGHWTPISKIGSSVWETVILWAVQGENEPLKTKLEDYPTAKMTVTS